MLFNEEKYERLYLYEGALDMSRKKHGEYKIFKIMFGNIYTIVPMKRYAFRDLVDFISTDYIQFIIRVNNKIKKNVPRINLL